MRQISDNLAALAVVLETAKKYGFPMPYVANAWNDEAKVQFHPDEFRTWVEWLGTDIVSEETDDGTLHHVTSADFDGRPVQFVAVERVTQAAKP